MASGDEDAQGDDDDGDDDEDPSVEAACQGANDVDGGDDDHQAEEVACPVGEYQPDEEGCCCWDGDERIPLAASRRPETDDDFLHVVVVKCTVKQSNVDDER